MFFNGFCWRPQWKLALLMVTTFSVGAIILGCADENVPYEEPLNVVLGGESQCLKDASRTVDSYFSGTLEPDNLIGFWDCAQNAVHLFAKYVRGDTPGVFQPSELKNYLETYFMAGNTLPQRLVDEAMWIKVLFLGGSATHLTLWELIQTEDIIAEFKKITLQLSPHMKTISESEPPLEWGNSTGEIDQAIVQLSQVSVRLGQMIQSQGVRYEFKHLQGLLLALSDFLSGKEKQNLIRDLHRLIPFVGELKALFLGGSSLAVDPSEWSRLFRFLSMTMGVGLRSHFILKHSSSWHEGPVLGQIERAVNEAFGIGEENLFADSTQHLSMDQLSLPLKKLAEYFRFSDKETESWEKVIQQAWMLVTRRLLGEKTPSSKPWPDLTWQGWQTLRREFDQWDHIQSQYIPFLIQQQKEGSPHLLKSDQRRAEGQMVTLLSNPWLPLMNDVQGRLRLSRTPMSYDSQSLSQLNWERTLVQWLIRVYSTQQQGSYEWGALTKKELKVAYREWATLFLDLGWLESFDESFIDSTLKEANLFLPRGNGDHLLSFQEGVELVHFVVSASQVTKVFQSFDECAPPREDLTEKVPWHCYKYWLQTKYPSIFSNMPALVAFMHSLNSTLWQDFIKHLEKAVREKSEWGQPLSWSEVTKLNVLLQYIETFMLRFDANQSQKIEISESLEALPIYAPILAHLLGLDLEYDQAELEAFFTYLMKKGAPPDPNDWFSVLEYSHWRINPPFRKTQANRLTLASILASLASL